VVDAAGDVGIGTSTPDSALTVVNGALFQRGVRMSGLPTAAGTRALRINANGTLSVSDTLANGISGSGTTNYIPKFTSSSAIGNSIISEASGVINVAGNLATNNTNGILTLANGNTSGGNKIQSFNSTGNANGYLAFEGYSAEYMRLDASGNLGLGVTPSAWSLGKAYEINSVGNGLWSYSNDNIYLNQNAYFNSGWKYATSATAAQYIQFQGQHIWNTAASGTAGNAISFTQAMTLDANSILSVRTTSTIPDVLLPIQINAVATTGQAYFAANNNGSYGLLLGYDNVNGYARIRNISNTALTFETNNTERMRLDALGNLGVGTSVNSGARINAFISEAGATPNPILRLQNTGSNYLAKFILTDGNTNDGVIGYQGGSTSATQYLGFGLGANPTQMILTAAGNVGIGTTSPASYYATRLVTYANNEDGITIAGNGGIQYLMFADGTSGDDRYRGYIQYSHTSDFMAFASNAVERMRLTSTGNVGIGTTSPSQALNVVGNGRFEAASGNRYVEVTSSTSSIQFGTDGSTQFIYGAGAFPLTFSTNGSEKMRITSAGNVGIGTSSPAVRLDVLESGSLGTASSGTIARFTSTGASGFDALIGIVGGNAGRSILDLGDSDAAAVGRLGYDHTSNFMFFNTNSAERMRITSGGEVYIAGTTDQGAYNLQVNGTGVWGAGAYVDGSDSAVKKNIQPLGSALDLIKQMNPVTFEYQPFYSKDTTTQTGFIAQELQQVLSDKVYKNGIVKEGGQYLGVAYQHLIPLLVKSIQELEAQVQALKSQLNK
jgi:hypothetical protein